jgi:cell wall-associated NlpC family hydrolase
LKRKSAKTLTAFALAIGMTITCVSPAFASTTGTKVIKNELPWILEQEEKAVQDQMAKKAAEEAAAKEAQQKASLRQTVVDYALSFVGGRYVYGGTNPNSGVDCSGFTKYVLENAAGVSVGRTSRDQAAEGISISAEEMQPGDLLFYGSGSYISHVAMYIGNGQIVHASTERTGIKVSQWNYKTPVRIVNMLG